MKTTDIRFMGEISNFSELSCASACMVGLTMIESASCSFSIKSLCSLQTILSLQSRNVDDTNMQNIILNQILTHIYQ